jgi:hypothetical protein
MDNNNSGKPQNDPRIGQSIPIANRLLAFTASSVWKGMKGLVHIALRLPRLFVNVNTTQPKKDIKQ